MSSLLQEEVHINWGNLLEDQLAKWRGGGRHANGIAEYISNSDDSYRRLKKFHGQPISVEIHSKRGRHIDRLVIRDAAEGMSLSDLEKKFFQYFESWSGREQGQQVSGRFGTGGKAYAIMNFEQCWITSVKDELENKAWFKWDSKQKKIVKGYNKGGYQNRRVAKPNGTTVELIDSLKVSHELVELMGKVEKSTRIRHVLKQQKVAVRFCKRHEDQQIDLRYAEPQGHKQIWEFEVPSTLGDGPEKSVLILRYFEKPLGEDSFIDVSDGISSVADLEVSRSDARPFSCHFNGALTLRRLRNSRAVRENRKGLEEGDDFTLEIESFVKQCVSKAVSEVEEQQREKERNRRLSASYEKLRELSKFLKKCDMRFREELRELKRRLAGSQISVADYDNSEDSESVEIFRKPLPEDAPELLVRGRWATGHGPCGDEGNNGGGIPQFVADPDGDDLAVRVAARRRVTSGQRKSKEGLAVLMSDDDSIPDRPAFGEYDDPVSDRDMETKGIIWINANHPLIVKRREKSDNDPVFLEMVANYVLMVVSQYQAGKQYESEQDDEKSDPMLLFRQKFFSLQRRLREDSSISYFDGEQAEPQKGAEFPEVSEGRQKHPQVVSVI